MCLPQQSTVMNNPYIQTLYWECNSSQKHSSCTSTCDVLITPKNRFQSFGRTQVPAESSQKLKDCPFHKVNSPLWDPVINLRPVGVHCSIQQCGHHHQLGPLLLSTNSNIRTERLFKPEWISKYRINTSLPKERAECIDPLFESLTSPLSMCTYWLHWDKILPELNWSNRALCWLMDV
jgi:hypothetical protein